MGGPNPYSKGPPLPISGELQRSVDRLLLEVYTPVAVWAGDNLIVDLRRGFSGLDRRHTSARALTRDPYRVRANKHTSLQA